MPSPAPARNASLTSSARPLAKAHDANAQPLGQLAQRQLRCHHAPSFPAFQPGKRVFDLPHHFVRVEILARDWSSVPRSFILAMRALSFAARAARSTSSCARSVRLASISAIVSGAGSALRCGPFRQSAILSRRAANHRIRSSRLTMSFRQCSSGNRLAVLLGRVQGARHHP
jgi:hypothetical protein